nr:RimK/LysX family protein [Alkalilimnicola ehrlichii]
MKRSAQPRLWVGWREWAALPELGIRAIKAKVDTGASTSALHAIHIQRFRADGRDQVRFEVHPLQRRTDVTLRCVADVIDERAVTSSNGQREKRIVIRTPLWLGGQQWPIELTLTNRGTMGFRMLLGRRAMHERILVDPTASHLADKPDAQALVISTSKASRT